MCLDGWGVWDCFFCVVDIGCVTVDGLVWRGSIDSFVGFETLFLWGNPLITILCMLYYILYMCFAMHAIWYWVFLVKNRALYPASVIDSISISIIS